MKWFQLRAPFSRNYRKCNFILIFSQNGWNISRREKTLSLECRSSISRNCILNVLGLNSEISLNTSHLWSHTLTDYHITHLFPTLLVWIFFSTEYYLLNGVFPVALTNRVPVTHKCVEKRWNIGLGRYFCRNENFTYGEITNGALPTPSPGLFCIPVQSSNAQTNKQSRRMNATVAEITGDSTVC